MEMTWLQTIIIAIIEGLTEFLPVSSTGHMIIAQKALNVPSSEFVKAFTVMIQFGAILSVVVLYFKRFFQTFDFYLKLLIAFIPAAVVGLLLNEKIDALLDDVMIVSIMLILGGILMIFVDKWLNKPAEDQTMTPRKAAFIGLAQCVAMIPGVSRSMATIVGGMSQKLTRKHAAEFSFFLAVPTMFAASAYKLLKLVMTPETKNVLMDNMTILILGNVVAFLVAMLAIRFFIGFITRYGFKAFGYYRIVVGVALLVLILCGTDLSLI